LIESEKKHKLNSVQIQKKKELEEKISDINQKLNPASKYTDDEIEKVVIALNLYLKNII
jgi:flagellar hook-associated protein FlgK